MYKKSIAIFFTVVFMGFIVAPSIIIALDDTIDTSIFYSMAEEEENGKSKKGELTFSLEANDYSTFDDSKNQLHLGYRFKNYPIPHLNLISPPPERI
ncbi:hypothetical protein [Snuella lapsa]|uniref:Uncharacterized protein n=1 Tax=Snuella lapsa TaxID=870481 RepID=A0ABP6X442_9FLAO